MILLGAIGVARASSLRTRRVGWGGDGVAMGAVDGAVVGDVVTTEGDNLLREDKRIASELTPSFDVNDEDAFKEPKESSWVKFWPQEACFV